MALDTAEKLQYVTNIITRAFIGRPESGLDERARANASFMYLLDEDFEIVPLTNIQTLYPMQPNPQGNTIVYRLGNSRWVSVKKSESLWRGEIITLRHKGQEADIEALFTFLKDFKGQIVTLTTDGIQPFIRPEETNNVKIISHSKPARTLSQYWEISVTYRNTLVS